MDQAEPFVESKIRSELDRSISADQVVRFFSQARRRLAILYGKRGSRKSDLIRRWVMPRLDSIAETELAECDPSLIGFETGAGSPERIEGALKAGKMVFLVHADHCLISADERYPAVLLNWIQSVEENRLPGSLVLLVPEQALSNVLTLQNIAPSLLSNILKIDPISFRDSLLRLTSVSEQSDLTYDPAAVDLLDRQAQMLNPGDPIELAQGIHRGLKYFKQQADRVVTVADCEAIGGILGALDELRRLTIADANERFGSDSENVIELILVEISSGPKEGRAFEITELALRLGVEPGNVDQVLTWLRDTERVLRRDSAGGFELVPIELSAAIEQKALFSHKEISRSISILRDGVRIWSQLGAVLPQKRLDEINVMREWLVTSDEEAVVVVRSLLRIANLEDHDSLGYWLHRIRSQAAQISILRENLFAASPPLRRKTAELLAAYDDREVLKQLHRVATEDPAADVRAAALASLATMNTDELWPLVSQEAREPNSPYQVHAVACLRLFKDDRSWQFLMELISADKSSAEVKREAIDTLAQLRTSASIKALVEVGLYHRDPPVRELAGAALATVQSAEFARQAVDEVRHSGIAQRAASSTSTPVKSLFAAAWQIAAGFGIAAINIFVHGHALMRLRRFKSGLMFLGIEAAFLIALVRFTYNGQMLALYGLLLNCLVCQLVTTRASYSWLKEPGTALSWSRNPRPRSRLILSLFCALLALDALAILFIHGVVHALAGRYRRSLKLLFFEGLGVGCIGAGKYLFTSDTAWITPLPTKISHVMSLTYVVVGIAFFLYTLVADLVPPVIEAFRNQSGGAGWRVRMSLLRTMATNPLVAEYLLQSVQAGSDADHHWARKVVRHTARVMPYENVIGAIASYNNPSYIIRGLAPVTDKELLTAITQEVKQAKPQVQKRFVDVLTCRPSEASLAELRPLRKITGWYGFFRYSAGVWYHRLRVWPSGVLLVIILVIPFPILAAVEMIKTSMQPDRPVIRMVENSLVRKKLSDDQLLESLQFLAKVDRDTEFRKLQDIFASSTSEPRPIWTDHPDRLAVEVCSLPLKNDDPDHSQKLNAWRRQLFFLVARDLQSNMKEGTRALATIRERDDGCGIDDTVKQMLVNAASQLMKDKPSDENISLALVTLDTAHSAAAVGQLKVLLALLNQAPDPSAATSKPEQASRDEQRRKVITAIAGNDSEDATSALKEVANSRIASPSLAKFAQEQLAARDKRQRESVLDSVRSPLQGGDYATAYDQAAKILTSNPDAPLGFRNEVLELQAKAAYNIAISAGDTEPWATKAIDAYQHLRKTQRWNTGLGQELSVAYQLRAGMAIQQNQYDRALSDARLAIDADRNAALAYEQAAWALQAQGKTEQSFPLARRAIEIDPTMSASYSLLYEVHYSRVEGAVSKKAREAAIEAAVSDFRELAAIHPDIFWPNEFLAFALHDLAFNFEQSYSTFKDLQRFEPSMSDAAKLDFELNFMENKFTVGRFNEVGDAVKQLQDQVPPTNYNLLIPLELYAYMSSVELGNMDSARTAWKRLLDLVSRLPQSYQLTWRYDGTVQYLKQKSPEKVQQALSNLVVSMNELGKKRQIPAETINESQAILQGGH